MVRGWLLVVAACSGAPRQPDPKPAPSDAAVDAAEPDRMDLVTSSVVVEACPDARKLATKQASKEIAELVGPCTRVPGGAAHFSATLLPDGSIHLGSPTGSKSEDGVVPTCVVQHARQLKHKLALAKPCRFDVRLSERSE